MRTRFVKVAQASSPASSGGVSPPVSTDMRRPTAIPPHYPAPNSPAKIPFAQTRHTPPLSCPHPSVSTTSLLSLLALAFLLVTSLAPAQERQGAFIAELTDDDGDQVILMETDWISMRLMPGIGSTVINFTFRPTQNDIVDLTQPKNLIGGGGMLQDNVWEQDWRFQELRGKWYDYRITRRGPDEVQVVFETKLDGWIGQKDSGIISKLLQDLKIRRTVTLRQGTPHFLFEVEFLNDTPFAKLPLYWMHNCDRIDATAPDHVFRPSATGIKHLPGKGEEFVYNFNHGWSARVSPTRREGVVYLMDYDYVSFLYNNQPNSPYTDEWVYDNFLILNNQPRKTHIHVIPVMGLERVDHATEYFITQVQPTRQDGRLRIAYKLTSSYEKVRKITLIPTLVHNLLGTPERRDVLAAIEVPSLGIEPHLSEVEFPGDAADPVIVRTKAFIELPDGSQIEREFEHFHTGDYSLGGNILKDLKTPVKLLARTPQNPLIPTPTAAHNVNRTNFNVFGLFGSTSRVLKLEDAFRTIPNLKLDAGYHPGVVVDRNGLTDFPYDYDRLFNYRAIVLNNSVFEVARHIGMSILINYLDRGGGLFYGGGPNTFTGTPGTHPIYSYLPIASAPIDKATLRLNSPLKDHPIFQGINLSDLPYTYYFHAAKFRENLPSAPKVLLKAGDHPFLVEYAPRPGQRVMILLGLAFGDPADNPGKPPFYDWPEWQKLVANILRYAARDL